MASAVTTKADRDAEKAARKAAVDQAVSDGHIKLVDSKKNSKGEVEKFAVTIPFKTLVADGIRREDDEDTSDLSEPFVEEQAVDYAGALALCGGDEAEVWETFSEAHNQYRRQLMRQNMLNKARGPQRHINQIVKRLVALGFSEEDATEQANKLASQLG